MLFLADDLRRALRALLFFAVAMLTLAHPTFAADRPAGVTGDGVTDDTAAIQAALDAQGKTGGEVFLPPGQYLIKGSVNVPTGVTLRGSWDAPHHGAWNKGTTLVITGGRGREDGPAAVELQQSSALQGVTMVWPDQRGDNVVAYPWAVHGQGMHNDVENVTFINAYQGIHIGIPWSELHLIRNIFGCVLRRGILIDTTSDIGRIENVHFNEHYWMRSGYPSIVQNAAVIDPAIVAYSTTHLEAFTFGRTDWEYVANTFVYGAKIGYHFINTPAGACNGQLMGIGADDCQVGVQIDGIQSIGLQITNGEFTAFAGPPNCGVVVGPEAGGAVQFVNCNFWGTPGGVAQINGPTAVTFSDCHFLDTAATGAIVANKGRLIVHGCNFAAAGTAVVLKPGVHAAIVTENMQPGGVQVQNGIGPRAQIGLNEMPVSPPLAQIGHYRVKIGTAGEEDYVQSGWYGPEPADDVPAALKPDVKTARWASGSSKLRLPVKSGSAYTLTLWASLPSDTPLPTIAVVGGPKLLVAKPGSQVLHLTIPATVTKGQKNVTVTITGETWSPAKLHPPNADTRDLTLRVFAVEMTAAGSPPGPVNDLN